MSKLTDREIKAWLSAGPKLGAKLFDGGGLFLTVTAAGSPMWRLKFRFAEKESSFTIGRHGEVSLREARERRDSAKAMLRDGKDPVVQRRVERVEAEAATGNTFAECAAAWLEKKKPGWSATHYRTVSEQLERHVLKTLGPLPIASINPPLVAYVVEQLSDRVDTAQKVRQIVEGVFRLAIALGKFTGDNPATAAREVIPRRRLHGRRPAFTTWPELGDLLRRAETANLSSAVRMAHRLCAFSAARMGNIIAAEWSEFRLTGDTPSWVIPREKMKAQDRHHDHRIVLGASFVAELRQWHLMNRSPSKGWLFQSPAGDDHITHESIEKAYRVTLKLKDKHTPHGWRAAFSTLAKDNGFKPESVDLALDHVHDDAVARAYDRGERLDERIKLADWWTEHLLRAQRGDL